MGLPIPQDQAETDKFLYDSANRVAVNIKDSAPLDIRYDADDSQPTYIGLNYLSYNANIDSLTWTVFKYTYSGANATRIQRRDAIAWSARSTSF
jgi:hypothetical protein